MAATRVGKLTAGRVVRGDAFSVYRRIRLRPGTIISTAYLTVKFNKTDPDPGVFKKTISISSGVDGLIENDGSDGRGVGILRFNITADNTNALTADMYYYYDIRIATTSGTIETLEQGVFSPTNPVTIDI